MVHIAHNVKLGKNCLICGQVGIAGSTIIGDRVVMAGQVGVGDNLSIGSDVIIAGKSGVSSNVPANRFRFHGERSDGIFFYRRQSTAGA